MTMFVLLMLFTCACALAVDDELPPYGDLRDSIHTTVQILNDNVLSMDGNIPLIDDPRRHYAEILSVVYSQAIEASACTEEGYYRDYQKNLNQTTYVGVVYPQKIVDGIRKLMADVMNAIDDVLTLVNLNGPSSREADKAIDDEIKKDQKFEKAQIIFLAAGLAATELNKNHIDYFTPRSNNLSSLKFVITGARKIRKLVMAVHDFSKVTYGIPDCK